MVPTIKRKLRIATALLASGLLVALILTLISAPGGLILPGWFLGGMVIVGIFLGGLVVAVLAGLIFKRLDKWTAFFSLLAIAFGTYYYLIWSPTLEITVPVGYVGEVHLVKSNVGENILRLDSHGIGYLSEGSFDRVWSKPKVVDTDGKDLSAQCVGFNPSTFFGSSTSSFNGGKEIESLTFEIAPIGEVGSKHFYHTDLTSLVDMDKVP